MAADLKKKAMHWMDKYNEALGRLKEMTADRDAWREVAGELAKLKQPGGKAP
jgi:hypothetical protein